MMLRDKRKLNKANDTTIVVQADGEEIIIEDMYRSGNDLCHDTENFAAPVKGVKIPEYKPTRIGRPPIQDRLVYEVDYEPTESGRDDEFCHRLLPALYQDAATGHSRDDEKDKKRKLMMDTIYVIVGAAFLVHAFFLAPTFGWQLGGGNVEQPTNTAPAPPPSPTPSIIIEER